MERLGDTIRRAKNQNNETSGRIHICCLEGGELSGFLNTLKYFEERFPGY